MSLMQSVEILAERVGPVRAMIPVGVEHYVVSKNGFTYLNVRTNDHAFVRRVVECGRLPS